MIITLYYFFDEFIERYEIVAVLQYILCYLVLHICSCAALSTPFSYTL